MIPLAPGLRAEQLRALAASPSPSVRAAVAGHPNTPPELLGALGYEFPAEVLGNPALSLLRLAGPGLVRGWPARTLERLTALPSAPLWLLRLGACHPVIDVQLAVSARPDLAPDVLETLAASSFWTVREAVAREATLPGPALERLSRDLDYGVRLSVAGRRDLPLELRGHLREDPHPLVRAVLLLQELER